MAGSWFRRPHRRALRPPLDVLIEDPATFRAAADAFARTERPDEPSWPYVAAVGPERVVLRWAAALRAPEPEAPWRAGPDPRLWTSERAELDAFAAPGRAGASRPLVIGEYLDSVVFLNLSRAPGPIVVRGNGEGAARLRELITLQRPGGSPEDVGLGAWWPVHVEEGTVYLLGLALATLLAPARVQRAAELAFGAVSTPAPIEEPVERETLRGIPVPRRRGEAVRDTDEGVEDWLRRLRATSPQDDEEPEPEPEQAHVTLPLIAAAPEKPSAPTENPETPVHGSADPADPADPAVSAEPVDEKPQPPREQRLPEQRPVPEPSELEQPEQPEQPAPEQPESGSDGLVEDWESGFAVSSAEHAE